MSESNVSEIEPWRQESLQKALEALTDVRISLTRNVGTSKEMLSHVDTQTIVTWIEKCSLQDINALPELFRLFHYQAVPELELSQTDPDRQKKIDSAREIQQRVLLSLALKELNKACQKGQRLETSTREFYFQLLKNVSIKIQFFTPGEIMLLGKALTLITDENRQNNQPFQEMTLLFQTLQELSPYTLGLETIATRNNFENDYQLQPYPTEQVETLLIEELGKDQHDDDKLIVLIISLTSPYVCELGDSHLGRKNLSEIHKQMTNSFELFSKIIDEDKKKMAERILAFALVNAFGPNELRMPEVSRQLSFESQKWMMDYSVFRKQQPLGQDRLNRESQSNKLAVAKELQFSVCISINANHFAQFVHSGYNYLSSHERAISGGHSSLANKVIGEAATGLLATGLPGDPYVRYAFAQEKQPWGDKWRQTQYGGLTFILKQDAIINHLSATDIDSLQSDVSPLTNIGEINQAFRQWKPHIDQPQNADYLELQIGKAITADDIDSIVVNPLELQRADYQIMSFSSGAMGIDPELLVEALKKLHQDYPSIQLKDLNGNPLVLNEN